MEKYTIRAARVLSGKTQQEMANKLSVHLNTYAKWEKHPDKIPIKSAREICSILGLALDQVNFFSE